MTMVRSGLHLPPHSRLRQARRPVLPAVFLDRDGVLVRDVHYLRRAGDLKIVPDVEEMRKLQERFYLIVATNQSGIARGFLDEDTLLEIHSVLSGKLEAVGIVVDAFYYCPHLETGTVMRYRTACACRKPAPGMLLQAAEDWNLPLQFSYMIGDSGRDVEAGRAAGLAGNILLGASRHETAMHAETLANAVDLLLQVQSHA